MYCVCVFFFFFLSEQYLHFLKWGIVVSYYYFVSVSSFTLVAIYFLYLDAVILDVYIYAAAAAKSLQSCPTLRPHKWQPTRLLCLWDSPGKNTGVGCHFLLQLIYISSVQFSRSVVSNSL